MLTNQGQPGQCHRRVRRLARADCKREEVGMELQLQDSLGQLPALDETMLQSVCALRCKIDAASEDRRFSMDDAFGAKTAQRVDSADPSSKESVTAAECAGTQRD